MPLAKKLNPAWTSAAPARSALYGAVLGQDGGSKPQACSTTDAASIVVRDAFGDCNGLRSSPGAPLLDNVGDRKYKAQYHSVFVDGPGL
jgi:hypothetical protein